MTTGPRQNHTTNGHYGDMTLARVLHMYTPSYEINASNLRYTYMRLYEMFLL